MIWPSGKGLGGSSLINGQLVVRGNRKNYNDWAMQGAIGWSYFEVLPYFKKLEANQNPSYVRSGFHGEKGPEPAQDIPYFPPLKRKVFKAARELGYDILDSNGPRQTGFFNVQGSLRNGQRCSTAKAYLVPAENKTNLHILTNAFVHKVIIENYKAVGVLFDVNGTMHEVKSTREVIMSAGTINSAQLLMLSGIGPKTELAKHKIPFVMDLPVGENLQDHCSAIGGFEFNPKFRPLSKKLSSNHYIDRYIKRRTGPLASLEGLVAIAFLNHGYIRPNTDDPNYQLYLMESDAKLGAVMGVTPQAYAQYFQPYEDKTVGICNSQVLQPKSRGTVKLKSSDARDPPLIDPNYFAESQDLDDVIEGMKTCQNILATRAMRKIQAKPFNTTFPGCENFEMFSYGYFKCQALAVSFSQSHEVGTVKMGNPNDPTTVVDPELRVKGISGLRVVDASVMPIVTSGNTNIPTIMVAEKASDIIKGSIEC